MNPVYYQFLRRFANLILAIPRAWKRLIVVSVDTLLCLFTVYFAFYLRLGYWVNHATDYFLNGFFLASTISVGLALPVFIFSGLYLSIFRYSGLPALLTVTKAVCIYALAFAFLFSFIGIDGVPRTVGIIQPILLLLFVGFSRAFANIWLGGAYLDILKSSEKPRALIYGAGSAGRQLAAALANSHEIKVVGFLDDDSRLHGHVIHGLKIYGTTNIASLIKTLKISNIFLALPSLRRSERNEILKKLTHLKVSVRTLPGLVDLARGKIMVSDLRDLEVEDLLNRSAVDLDGQFLPRYAADKVIMVTGAGGSIGSELCRQIIELAPSTLVLLEHSEIALYQIHSELTKKIEALKSVKNLDISLVPILGSVVDEQAMGRIMTTFQPQIIYHAAAYKHVPIVEVNPFEGVKTNTFGTLTLAQLAIKFGVAHFVLVSTDKAVNPTNVMGASKRLAELLLQALASEKSNTIFTMVRFGNVLASSGSVIPKFREQIKVGGPITVTDFRMTRYFMTITEAALLVLQAGSMAKGGEVFLLDMGEPVRILDLAKRMIELSGLEVRDHDNPRGDIEITEIGLRPGEKLYEELLLSGSPQATTHPLIYKANEDYLPWNLMQERLDELQLILKGGDRIQLSKWLSAVIPGYQPSGI